MWRVFSVTSVKAGWHTRRRRANRDETRRGGSEWPELVADEFFEKTAYEESREKRRENERREGEKNWPRRRRTRTSTCQSANTTLAHTHTRAHTQRTSKRAAEKTNGRKTVVGRKNSQFSVPAERRTQRGMEERENGKAKTKRVSRN